MLLALGVRVEVMDPLELDPAQLALVGGLAGVDPNLERPTAILNLCDKDLPLQC